MRIDFLSLNPDRVGRYKLRFDTGVQMLVYRQTVEDFGLYTGLELSLGEFQRLEAGAKELSAKMRAVRIVSASSVSKRDLERRLIQKGEEPLHAKKAVSWMSELSLIDDAVTAQHIVQRCIAKGYGLQRAKQALYEKRIPKEYWDEVLQDYPQQEEAIERYLRQHLFGDSSAKEIKKVVDALLRRGHSYGTIRRILNALSFDTEDFPED